MADNAAPIPLPSWESTDRYYLCWNVKCNDCWMNCKLIFFKYQINKHILKQYDFFIISIIIYLYIKEDRRWEKLQIKLNNLINQLLIDDIWYEDRKSKF